MTYKIEKNIPIPGRKEKETDLPLKKMKAGESFKILTREELNRVYYAAKKFRIKIVTRKNGKGRRVWRVS